MNSLLRPLFAQLRCQTARLRRRMREDGGYSTETVIVTALLALLALAVVGIIAAKVTSKANGIDLG
ncbi:hypothetical protein [Actinacidiphila sp. bgisy167]|uniref:hypothetical protein n=1 Tax=Actinacidiphila sp. bgisy167 TaxID=3413797 RepID=UPI003D7176D9